MAAVGRWPVLRPYLAAGRRAAVGRWPVLRPYPAAGRRTAVGRWPVLRPYAVGVALVGAQHGGGHPLAGAALVAVAGRMAAVGVVRAAPVRGGGTEGGGGGGPCCARTLRRDGRRRFNIPVANMRAHYQPVSTTARRPAANCRAPPCAGCRTL